MAVLQLRIERDAILLFGEVLASDPDPRSVIEQVTKDAVVLVAPRQASGSRAVNRLCDRTGATGELQRAG